MAIYKCSLCGMIYDEEKEGVPVSSLAACPFCGGPIELLERIDNVSGNESTGESTAGFQPTPASASTAQGEKPPHFDEIRELAQSGQPIVAAMGTQLPVPSWDRLLILGNQLNPPPLAEDAKVNLKTVIGKNAKKPLVLDGPVYVSHMSFGALSIEAKIALATGSRLAGTATCSGEGGIHPDERAAAGKYIFEIIPNLYSLTEENLKRADAIEIKIGQGTKPGMGGLLPGTKVTAEIAAIRQRPVGHDIVSPSVFPDIHSQDDLRNFVSHLREVSDGRPVGIKIAAGKLERDLEYCVYAKPDFITVDGRGGATGASPRLIRESTTIPTLYALARARKYFDQHAPDIALIITGGLRVSSDFAKAIALGADAVAIATAAMIAIGCQQYRICGSGLCPTGIATQEPHLKKNLDVDRASERLARFLNASFLELKTFARITGHKNIHDLCRDDLAAVDDEIARHLEVAHI